MRTALGDLGDEADRIDLAMATVDPERDTGEVLTPYVQSFVPDARALRTTDDADLQAAADLFGVTYDVTTTDEGEVEVSHSGFLYAVDDGMLAACGSDGGNELAVAPTEGEADFEYVIPQGAGVALDAGEPLEILPARLEPTVRQVIQIENDDERGHLIGPFFVGAGETLRQRFSSPGEFTGECTVHPSGQITLAVT